MPENNSKSASDYIQISQLYQKGLSIEDILLQTQLSKNTVEVLVNKIEKQAELDLIKTPEIEIYRDIDSLERLYRRYVHLLSFNDNEPPTQPDVKLLQGIERCLELKMKLLGFDGKRPFQGAAAGAQKEEQTITIDLSCLSKNTIEEILLLTNKNKKDGKDKP